MTKDGIIAMLAEQNAWLRQELADALYLLKHPPVTVTSPSDGALRQKRYRERHNVSQRDVTSDALGDYRGSNPVDLPGDTELRTLEPTTGKEDIRGRGVGKPKRHGNVTSDADHDWVSFRETYPKTDRTSWARAMTAWGRMNDVDRMAALNGCRVLTLNPPAAEFLKGAQSWLLERRWETVGDRPANGHRKGPDTLAGLREWNERMDLLEAQQ